MKTKKEIIQETVEYYSADVSRRSKITDRESEDFGSCRYLGPDGRRCAFSRCCKNNEQTLNQLERKEGKSAEVILSMFGQGVLEERYQGHEYLFWNRLQELHDGDLYWGEGGLTFCGERKAKEILEEFEEN